MTEAKFCQRNRVKANITQSDLARRLGWDTPQFISNIERGLSGLPNDKVKLFCNITGADLLNYVDIKIKASSRDIKKAIYKGKQ